MKSLERFRVTCEQIRELAGDLMQWPGVIQIAFDGPSGRMSGYDFGRRGFWCDQIAELVRKKQYRIDRFKPDSHWAESLFGMAREAKVIRELRGLCYLILLTIRRQVMARKSILVGTLVGSIVLGVDTWSTKRVPEILNETHKGERHHSMKMFSGRNPKESDPSVGK